MTNNTIPIKPLSSSTTTPNASSNASPRANDKVHEQLQRLTSTLESVVLGKPTQIRLAVACLLARGHLLIEDLPGMGKTLLSHAIAISLGLSYNRVQFTSDVLPADILGASIFDRNTGEFRFVEGPLFAQVVLADEINRATPKSQSALLEAMEERQVTSEGTTRQLPDPFFVLATQNPSTQTGTFPLPESQLDRFLMRIELGYPEPEAERELLRGGDRRELLKDMKPAIDLAELKSLQQAVSEVKASDLLIDYIQRVVNHSRVAPEFAFGLSPRGSLALLGASKAWALLHQRTHVVPEDVQAVLPSVVEHRLREAADFAGHGGAALAHKLLTSVDVVG